VIPFKKPTHNVFDKIIQHFAVLPSQCAFIGDRVFTDIIGANMAGMFSVLVDPIKKENDPIYVSVPRKIERIALSMHKMISKE